jgi:hypothetical protein
VSRRNTRPWFEAPPPPPPPTADMKPAMFGSFSRIAAICCWWRTIDSNDVPSAASVVPVNWSMSSLGMNPFGIQPNSRTVPTRMPAENTSAVRRCCITQPRLLS